MQIFEEAVSSRSYRMSNCEMEMDWLVGLSGITKHTQMR